METYRYTNRPHSYKRNEFLLFRNVQIKEDFRIMKNKGIKNKEAFALLSDKYFLSEYSINSIIYLKK